MKRLLPLIFILGLHLHSKAQFELQYIHEIGVGAAFNEFVTYPNIQYSPRLNVYEISSRNSLSLDARIGIGYAMESGTYVQDAYPLIYVPATINFNSGSCATRVNNEFFGFYIGGGYGYENAIDTYVIHGPVINGGFRFYLGKEPFDFNLSYLFDITEHKAPIFGLGFHYVLNMLK